MPSQGFSVTHVIIPIIIDSNAMMNKKDIQQFTFFPRKLCYPNGFFVIEKCVFTPWPMASIQSDVKI